ncbi:hypothetical protein [Maribacter algicola]|uniref:hypothetical protein n=1 Tax=Maribacter algicola TaxID=2498892 RepID=UPI000F652BAC|nr:hypothetical protein [Maribacter algicola]
MGCVVNPEVLGIGQRKSSNEYSDVIGNGLGDADQGLLGFQVSQNQPSLFGYFFGDGKSIGTKIPTLKFRCCETPLPTPGGELFWLLKSVI